MESALEGSDVNRVLFLRAMPPLSTVDCRSRIKRSDGELFKVGGHANP